MQKYNSIYEAIKDINSLAKLRHYLNVYLVNSKHKKYDGKISVLDYPPLFVTIGITGYCGFKCQFCVSHAVEAEGNHQHKVPFNMPFDEFKKIVDLFHQAKVPHIHIAGLGEPLFNKDFFRMFDYVTDKYFYSSLQTDFIKSMFEKKNIIEKIVERKDKIKYITTDLFPKPVHNKIKIGSDYDYVVSSIEKIAKSNSKIKFRIHQILTKQSYKDMASTILEFYEKGINFAYDVVNLHTLNFNDFTSLENAYHSTDTQITEELRKIKELSEKLGVEVNIPEPWDIFAEKSNKKCLNMWSKFQIMPSKKLPVEKWKGNAITSQCIAETMGDFFTIGNIFEHDTFMDFWNNDKLVKIRENMINGIYPDVMCKKCFKYKKWRKI